MYFDTHVIVARWPRTGAVAENWGDKLNPVLIAQLSQAPVAHVDDVLNWGDRPVFRVVGSGVSGVLPNEIVWGQGFLNRRAFPAIPPARISAVRGPKTRERLLARGLPCPEVYGDPAIFCPLFIPGEPSAQRRYGVIQHFREKDVIPPPKIRGCDDPLVIDVLGGIEEFVRDITSCEVIVSSSLHGVICAHAYGVPAYWVKASDLPKGDDFKFHDYYASIGWDDVAPAAVDDDGYFDPRSCPATPGQLKIDTAALLESCPFVSPERRSQLLRHAIRSARQGRKGVIYAGLGS